MRIPVAALPVMGMLVLIRLAVLIMAATVLLLLIVLTVVLLLLGPVARVVVRVVVCWGVSLGCAVARVAAAGADVADDPCPRVHQSCRRDGEALRRQSGQINTKTGFGKGGVWWWVARVRAQVCSSAQAHYSSLVGRKEFTRSTCFALLRCTALSFFSCKQDQV